MAGEAGSGISLSDEALIAVSKAAPARFGTLFERHADEIYGFIARRLGEQAAPDLVAEVFLVAFRGRTSFDPDRGLVRPWLYGIAVQALYRVMEQLPGVTSLGPVTDQLGRHGIGVGLAYDGIRQELIFDPATSTALESAVVSAGPSQARNNYQPAGTMLGYVVYVVAGLVNSATATLPPAATQG